VELRKEHEQDSVIGMKTRIMYFESIVLLAAESFSIYHQFFESLMALGRPRQSFTFVSKNIEKLDFSGLRTIYL